MSGKKTRSESGKVSSGKVEERGRREEENGPGTSPSLVQQTPPPVQAYPQLSSSPDSSTDRKLQPRRASATSERRCFRRWQRRDLHQVREELPRPRPTSSSRSVGILGESTRGEQSRNRRMRGSGRTVKRNEHARSASSRSSDATRKGKGGLELTLKGSQSPISPLAQNSHALTIPKPPNAPS